MSLSFTSVQMVVTCCSTLNQGLRSCRLAYWNCKKVNENKKELVMAESKGQLSKVAVTDTSTGEDDV